MTTPLALISRIIDILESIMIHLNNNDCCCGSLPSTLGVAMYTDRLAVDGAAVGYGTGTNLRAKRFGALGDTFAQAEAAVKAVANALTIAKIAADAKVAAVTNAVDETEAVKEEVSTKVEAAAKVEATVKEAGKTEAAAKAEAAAKVEAYT